MTKKNLSDLLQEEAQKFTPTDGESSIEVTAQKVVEENYSPAKESTPNTANLEATIKDLDKNLEQAQKKEASLQKQISDLKTELSAQEDLAERLNEELNETKKTALQLAESNSKLIEEINDLKQFKEPVKETFKEPVKSLSINPKKSHRSPERLQELPTQSNNDFADNTWLYD